jgi:hydrogenase-4 component B
MYALAAVIILIGLFPMGFINLLSQPVNLFTASFSTPVNLVPVNAFKALQPISLAAWIFILLVFSLFMLRKYILSHRKVETGPTWGCGYTAPTSKQQYTAGSFVRTYSKLFAPFLLIGKHEEEIKGIFPSEGKYHTHPYDEVEKWLIDSPLKANKSFMGRFTFLNNGKLQIYILYGVIFVLAVLSIPVIYQNVTTFFDFLKHL